EGGWSEKELAYFKEQNVAGLNLGDLTLRAETAAIVAVHALQ
ncbi:MAG: RsmE family RNA methyltransferase, partial [Patescibacteria group bacterium]